MLVVGKAFAISDFFGNAPRAEIFEKTDFTLPTLTITLRDDEFNDLFLRFECEHDTNLSTLTRNERCYTAPWISLKNVTEGAFTQGYLDKSAVSQKYLTAIKNGTLTLADFEAMLRKYSTYTLEQMFSPSYGLVKVPSGIDFSVEDAQMTFEVNGYLIFIIIKSFMVLGLGSDVNKWINRIYSDSDYCL